MDYPESIRAAVEREMKKHRDIDAQKKAAIAAARGLPEFAELRRTLENTAIEELVYRIRTAWTVTAKREAFRDDVEHEYQGKPKVNMLTAGMKKIYADFLDSWCIAGTCLGDIRGEDYAKLVTDSDNLSAGHAADARFYRALGRIVPEGKRTRDVISGEKAQALYRKVNKVRANAA